MHFYINYYSIFLRYKKKKERGKIPKPLCGILMLLAYLLVKWQCKYLLFCRIQKTYFQAGLIAFEKITALPLSKL